MILDLSLRGDLRQIMAKPVRPHTMLRKQQRQWQQNAEEGKEQAVQDGTEYKPMPMDAEPRRPHRWRKPCVKACIRLEHRE